MAKTLNTWYESLKESSAIGLDIETTHFHHNKARIYNIGVSTFPILGKTTHEDFFIKDLVDPENLTESFLKVHQGISSKKFAQGQIDRGVLEDYKKAIDSKDLHTVDEAFSKFVSQLEIIPSKKFILGQNLNFENKIFRSMVETSEESQLLSASTVNRYNKATNRAGIHKTVGTDLFADYKNIIDLRQGIRDSQNLSEMLGTSGLFRNLMTSVREKNTGKVTENLNLYFNQYDKIMDTYKRLINNSQVGATPIVDLQDITRALYARAAIAGDMNVEYIGHGSSLDFLSQTLFSKPEKHIGTADNQLTKDVFDIFVEEYDKYKADENYRSPVLQSINKSLKDGNEIQKKYIKNFYNMIEEAVEEGQHIDIIGKRLKDSFLNYSHFTDNRREREEILKTSLDILKDEKDTEKVLKYLDSISINTHQNQKSNVSLKDLDSSFISKHKGKLAIAGAVIGLSLMTGRSNEKQYDTYDELYSNNYYGSDFANWQERNNSHRVIY